MYESDQSAVTTALQGSSAAVFTDSTIAQILALTTSTTGGDAKVSFADAAPDASGNVTVAAGSEVVYVKTSDTVQTVVVAPKDVPVIIFQGAGGVDATINDGAATVPASAAGVVDRVVVGTAGADRIVISDAKNSQITIGNGDTVVAGAGNDTIVAGAGNSTVSGGTGHAIVEMKGNATDYVVTVQNGHAVVTNAAANSVTDITKIQYVKLDNGDALIFAKDSTEAAVSTLYQTVFGRDADASGLKYWFDQVKSGHGLSDVAKSFDAIASSNAATSSANLSDSEFIQTLYQRTFGRTGEAAGVDYWADALSHGVTRADLIASFSNIAANVIDGTMVTDATVVGSVTIIHDII